MPLSPHRLPLYKKVRVNANGMTYEGVLVGVDEEEVYLKSSTRTWCLSLKDIQSLERADDHHSKLQKSAWANEFDFEEEPS